MSASASASVPASPFVVLGSGSPRRREILTSLRVPFVVHVAEADETTLPGEDAATYLGRVVRAKLAAVTKSAFGPGATAPDEVKRGAAVLVADTSVIADGAILGKPADVDEAAAMIARLEGKIHEVWTRFAIGSPEDPSRMLHEETAITKVTFRVLGPARVRAYAESGEGLDKAGAYAVQGLGAGLVSRIEGSYSNVVGLPACEVVVALESLGLLP